MVDSSEGFPNESVVIEGLVGTVLGERFELLWMLGGRWDGSGVEGRDLYLGRAVAVQVMLPGR